MCALLPGRSTSKPHKLHHHHRSLGYRYGDTVIRCGTWSMDEQLQYYTPITVIHRHRRRSRMKSRPEVRYVDLFFASFEFLIQLSCRSAARKQGAEEEEGEEDLRLTGSV